MTTNSILPSQAFDDLFTNQFGNSYLVSVEPQFEEQITEAVNLIAKSRPENVRQSFISQFVNAAKLASPSIEPVIEQDDEYEEEEEENKEKVIIEETEEQKELKRKVIKDLIFSIKNLKFEEFGIIGGINNGSSSLVGGGGNTGGIIGGSSEFEGFFNLLLSLILTHFTLDGATTTTTTTTSATASSDYTNLILVLIDSIIFNSTSNNLNLTGNNDKLNSRYSTISTIFNALPLTKLINETASPSTLSSLKLTILIKLITFTIQNEDYSIIKSTLDSLPSYFTSWGYSLGQHGQEEGNLSLLSITSLLITKGQKTLARTLLLNHLATPSTVEGSSLTPSSSTKDLISQIIILSLSLPEIFNFSSLSSLPSISTPSSPELYTLLQIFQEGSLPQFTTFISIPSNQTLLEKNELNPNELKRKLNLLTLASLASNRIGEDLSYSEIALALNLTVPEGDDGELVESWVIDAIRSSLLTGRFSQPLQTFKVTKAVPKKFENTHWDIVESNLTGWKISLEAILESLRKGLGAGIGGGEGMGAVEILKGGQTLSNIATSVSA